MLQRISRLVGSLMIISQQSGLWSERMVNFVISIYRHSVRIDHTTARHSRSEADERCDISLRDLEQIQSSPSRLGLPRPVFAEAARQYGKQRSPC